MLALIISCWLVGMVLAQYFRIFALVPLILVACVLAAIINGLQGYGLEHIVVACLLIIVCLQLGFFFGAWIALPDEDRPGLSINIEKNLARLSKGSGHEDPDDPVFQPRESPD